MTADEVIRVVAAAVLSARGLLLVSKTAAPAVFYLPGGKPEPGEEPAACLRRELAEELGVTVACARPFLRVRAPAALEPADLEMSVFLTTVRGEPTPAAEICSLAWWAAPTDLGLAPAVRDVVIPRLQAAGHLPAAPAAS